MVVAEGTPESVAKVPESHTGRFLAGVLDLPAPAKTPKAKSKSAVTRAAPKSAAREPVKATANAK